MFVECITVPEVAVTAIVYVPAGVPVAGLSCCPDDVPSVPPQAVKPEVIRSNEASKNCDARHVARARMNRIRIPRMTPNTTSHATELGKDGTRLNGLTGRAASECAVVAIERLRLVGVLPGVIVADGLNEAVAPVGSPDTLNVTGLEKEPFEGAAVKVNMPVCPAVTVRDELGELTA
jgi:hypothetical protein